MLKLHNSKKIILRQRDSLKDKKINSERLINPKRQRNIILKGEN
jgi:hypothetical protein